MLCCWKHGSGAHVAHRRPDAGASVKAAKAEGPVPLVSPAGIPRGALAHVEEILPGQRGLSWMLWARISGEHCGGSTVDMWMLDRPSCTQTHGGAGRLAPPTLSIQSDTAFIHAGKQMLCAAVPVTNICPEAWLINELTAVDCAMQVAAHRHGEQDGVCRQPAERCAALRGGGPVRQVRPHQVPGHSLTKL